MALVLWLVAPWPGLRGQAARSTPTLGAPTTEMCSGAPADEAQNPNMQAAEVAP